MFLTVLSIFFEKWSDIIIINIGLIFFVVIRITPCRRERERKREDGKKKKNHSKSSCWYNYIIRELEIFIIFWFDFFSASLLRQEWREFINLITFSQLLFFWSRLANHRRKARKSSFGSKWVFFFVSFRFFLRHRRRRRRCSIFSLFPERVW